MAASERQEVIIIDSEDDASPRKSGSKGLSTTLKASAKAPSTAYKPSPQRRPPPATTPTNATRRDPLWNPLIPDDGLEHARPFADDITEISRPTNFGSLRRPNGSGPTSPDTSLPSPASSSMFSEASLSQPLKRKRPDGKYQAYVHGVNSQKRPKQPSFSPRRPARQPENGNAVPKPDTAGPVLESAKTDHSRTSALANASNADAIPDQTTSYSSKQVLSDKHPQASMAKAQLPPSIKSGAMSLEAHMNALTQALPRPTSTSTTTSGKSEKPGIRPNAGRVGPPVNGFPGKLLADLLQERRTPTVDVSASQVGVTERSRKPNEIKSAMHGATTNTASPTSRPSNLETIRNQNLSRSNGIPPQRSSIAEATSDTESKGIAPPNPRPEVRNERFRSGYSEPDTGSYIPSANIASRLTPQVSKSVRPSTKIDHLGHRGQKLNGRGDRREPARPRLPSGTTQAVKVAGQPNSDHTHSNVDSPSRRVSSVLGPMNKSFDLGSDALNTTKHNGNVTKPPSSRFKERETDTIRTTTNGTLSPHSTSTQADSGIPETSIEALQGKQSSKIVQTRTPESSRAVTPKTLPTDDQASSFFAKSPLSKSAMADMPPPTMIPPAAIRTISTKLDVEESLVRNLTSLAEDQKYMVKMALAKARSVRNVLQQADLSKDQPSRVFTDTKLERVYVNGMIGFKRPNPFQFLKPLHRTSDGKPDGTFNAVTVETVDPGAKRIRAPARMVGCRPTRWQDKNKSVPTYTHCTQVKKNVAAPNQKVLHSYPYFGENVDEKVYEALHTRYDIDVPQRNRKVLQSQQSRYYMRKLRQWLEQIGSSENDVLFYLLNPRTSGEQGDIYASRNKHCKEDFNREGRRWTRVFEELDKTNFSIKQVQVAAWACDTFLTKTGMSIWQVVRKAPVTDLEDASDDEEPFLDQIQEFACRVCHEHDCPYHIDFEEDDSDDSYDEDDPVASAEALDVDHPPDNNLKRHVTIAQPLTERPDSRDEIVVAGRPRSRDKTAYKRLLEQIVETSNHDRNRYYPCYHPGTSCSDEKCKCWRDNVLCEKACGCSESCDRKFQGCSCISGNRKVCYQDDRCDCFRLHRECDADLCRGCGADTALDPENRHDDNLRKECCQNVNMQLGIPKRTILGRSRIHGFGLYAGEKIKRHDFVGEYSGEIVLEEERVRRGEVYEIQKMSYLFILTADQEIDSHHVGNKMRFVNHASQTGRNGACNLRPEIVMCNMTPRIGMYATRDIEIGEELFFNYGDHYMSLLKDTVAADDAKDGDKEKPKRKGGRKKKIVRRRKKLADFAEPEYEDLDIVEKGEGTVGSKKVTPRYKPKAKREMASKSVSVATAGDDDEGEEVADSEVEDQVGDEEEDEVEETPIKSRRGGKRKTIVEEVEESDFEAEETPRRVSGRAAKKRRTVEEVDDDEDSEVDDPGKKVYVAPIVNGKKKRGRPKKNFFDGDD